jgi:hypothetical protein
MNPDPIGVVVAVTLVSLVVFTTAYRVVFYVRQARHPELPPVPGNRFTRGRFALFFGVVGLIAAMIAAHQLLMR